MVSVFQDSSLTFDITMINERQKVSLVLIFRVHMILKNAITDVHLRGCLGLVFNLEDPKSRFYN